VYKVCGQTVSASQLQLSIALASVVLCIHTQQLMLQGSGDKEVFSEEEIAKLAALKRARDKDGKKMSVIEGALSEVELIDWPQPGKAAVETVYVLVIVVGASAFLFGLNAVLSEVSKQLY